MHIQVSKRRGLDLPIKGAPSGQIHPKADPSHIALHVGHLNTVKFKVLAKAGEQVKLGQPILVDKTHPQRLFLSPAGGQVAEIRRGPKRRLISVVIKRTIPEPVHERPSINLESITRERLVEAMCEGGLFAHIHMRPFNLLANPSDCPRSIFVKAIESAPFVPPAEYQTQEHQVDFAYGLRALRILTAGPVHLVYRQGSDCEAFTSSEGVEIHTASGPHPCANHSLHIHKIDPIVHPDQRVWTLNVHDVVSIGKLLRTGTPHIHRIVAVAGPGVRSDGCRFLKVRNGHPIAPLLANFIDETGIRLISGDPLVGQTVDLDAFLGASHFVLTVLHQPKKRRLLHFLRIGRHAYSAHRAYLSGHLRSHRTYDLTTSLHGEERAFIDGALYDRVMPMQIPTSLLVKAILSGDYDHAEMAGVLEVAAEDFALPAFICPSKIEMVEIVRKGLHAFAEELLS